MAPPGLDLKLRLTLREGSVYYFPERSLTSAEPHCFIVVNSDPLRQEVLLLGVCTSKIAELKQRRRDLPETIVEISPQVFDVLKKISIVDCNDLKQVQLVEFMHASSATKSVASTETCRRRYVMRCEKRFTPAPSCRMN